MIKQQNPYTAPDDQPLFVLKRDLGGGMNNRQDPQTIGENQGVLLQNMVLETSGQREIRGGQTLVDSSYPPIYVKDDNGNFVLDDNGIPIIAG